MRNTSDLSLFLGQMLRRPQSVSALMPSSERLARAMAAEVPEGTGPVVELGPGTGKITRALLEAGIAPSDLHLLEINDDFVSFLRLRHPDVHLHHRGAQDMDRIGLSTARAVVSGLPLLSLPRDLQRAILEAAFRLLPPGAPLIQFTYGPSNPVPGPLMRDLGLVVERGRRVWHNMPPAQIYRLRRPAA